jgi:hybrid polyketide synthase/nonribosomal peptide synthetase ACE1
MLLVDNGEKLRIEKTSDFFLVGRNSLLLLKMQAEIRDRLSIDLTLPELFQNNTLESLSSRINTSGANHFV